MYDYVIVGAGSAGCVLAARLSEDPDVRVLLLEAGPPDTLDNIHIPLGLASLAHSVVDWDFWSGSEPHCDGRRIWLPRGRTLGGSSSINAMIYIRGNAADYDGWRDAGCTGWGHENLLPYFDRALECLTVSETRSRNPMLDAFVDAAVEAGYDHNDDFNSGRQDGFGRYVLTQRDGRRCSTAVAYLHPAMARPNLTVETGVQAHRVVFDAGRAVGVEGSRNGELLRFDCEREVILSGGAYNSPHLLMLSGVGPAEHLRTRLVEPVADRPMVGRNLQDHVQAWAVWKTDEPVSLDAAMAPENIEASLALFETEGAGPLTSNYSEAGGFARTSPDLTAPDVQYHAIAAMETQDPPFGMPDHGMSIGVCLLTPESRGEVLLASDEPTAKPYILHRYYASEHDMARMEAGIAIALEIGRQPALERYCQELVRAPASSARDDVRAWLRRHAETLFHPVGTCAMGPDDDAVVDVDLRVRGVEALRVVDASVMPTVPRGNTNAPVIAIAERAADLIRGVELATATAGAAAGTS
jgi:choline dehydrogenase